MFQHDSHNALGFDPLGATWTVLDAWEQFAGFPYRAGRADSGDGSASWPGLDVLTGPGRGGAVSDQMEKWSEHLRSSFAAAGSLGEFWTRALETTVSAQTSWRDALSNTASQMMAAATGLNQTQFQDALRGEWSPGLVAIQSLFPLGHDFLQLSAECAESAARFQDVATASLRMSKLLGEGWLRANNEFTKAASTFRGRSGSEQDVKEIYAIWTATAEPILQGVLRSQDYLDAQADMVRAGAAHAEARSKIMRRVADALEVPDRKEMNETYEAIQEMRREIRKLKRTQRTLRAQLAGAATIQAGEAE